MDCGLLAQGATPAVGMTNGMSEGESGGAEEKETRNPSRSPGD